MKGPLKRMALALAACAATVAVALAATETIEYPIVGYSYPLAVSVSTFAYTNVTSTSTRIRDMSGLLLNNPPTNGSGMHGHIGDCTSTDVSTSTVRGPVEVAPSSATVSVGIAEDVCLWLLSRHTAAESVSVQGVRQRRQ